MFFYRFLQASARSFSIICQSFQLDKGLPFAEVLSERDIKKAFDDNECRFGEGEHDIFTPAVTLWGFLSQVLFTGAERSCKAAVHRISLLLERLGRPVCSANDGGFCKARAKIAEGVPKQLVRTMCERAERMAKSTLPNGRKNVWLVDGTTATGPDTAKNQAEYPQSDRQRKGCGFPMMRIVVLVSLMTAMVRSVAVGPYRGKGTGESALFRELAEDIPPGSVVVGDRYYCSYFAFVELWKKGIDVVARVIDARLEGLGKRDAFKRLKNGDLLVTWKKSVRPDWMSLEEHRALPDSLTVRYIEVRVGKNGFRTQHLHIVTTLLAPETDPRESLIELYHDRWHVELDLRAIKTTLGLDILRGQTPHMMRLEFFVGLLAYNLIRLYILNSAATADDPTVTPRNISFTMAQNMIATSLLLIHFMDAAASLTHTSDLLRRLATHRVGHRLNRVEPRVLKRQQKAYPHPKEPRSELRKKLCKHHALVVG